MRQPGGVNLPLPDDAATRAAGGALAGALATAGGAGLFVTLSGELGAGKTTLVRGVLSALGVDGPVRSPTYTLLETYRTATRLVHHFDWYRLSSTADLEALGIRELLAPGQWVLAEWPERVPEVARVADVAIHLGYEGTGRRLTAEGLTAAGEQVVTQFNRATTLE
jgi:tRNA threonylcarbamoyladenosine biosynthesis protein TsaE